MGKTTIEWTDETWNPVTGCTKVSPGCTHCYAERMTERFGGDFSKVVLHPDRLDAPLHWRKPRRCFVCSMSDLFHEDVPDEFIERVFAIMECAGRHTFQVLTKRSRRMRDFLQARDIGRWDPPKHIWCGVSCEDQQRANERIPDLLATPAAVRFVSAEPLLEPLELREEFQDNIPLDWVIIGGESGPGARLMDPTWAKDIVGQCKQAGVPVFVKQLGSAAGGRQHKKIENFPLALQVREWPK